MTGIGEHTGEPSARVPTKDISEIGEIGGSGGSGGSGAAVSDHSPVSRRLRGQSDQPGDHEEGLPVHPQGTLPPDPQMVQPVTAQRHTGSLCLS